MNRRTARAAAIVLLLLLVCASLSGCGLYELLGIDTHDYETKLNQARKFLSSGNKVRVVMKFRGREMSHMAMGRDILEKFLADTHEVGSCDKKPVLEGRFMSMVINPLSNKAK